jgi:hypothetical protein
MQQALPVCKPQAQSEAQFLVSCPQIVLVDYWRGAIKLGSLII